MSTPQISTPQIRAKKLLFLQRPDGRWVIAEVIDLAQGRGYQTQDAAKKAAWYLYQGGKAQLEAKASEGEVAQLPEPCSGP